MAIKGNDTTATQRTENVDKKISIGGNGDVQTIQDSTLNLASGASVSLNSANADVARSAINSVIGATKSIAAGSNAIAANVAESQSQFVATASGQKYIVYVVAAVAVGAVAVAFNRK